MRFTRPGARYKRGGLPKIRTNSLPPLSTLGAELICWVCADSSSGDINLGPPLTDEKLALRGCSAGTLHAPPVTPNRWPHGTKVRLPPCSDRQFERMGYNNCSLLR